MIFFPMEMVQSRPCLPRTPSKRNPKGRVEKLSALLVLPLEEINIVCKKSPSCEPNPHSEGAVSTPKTHFATTPHRTAAPDADHLPDVPFRRAVPSQCWYTSPNPPTVVTAEHILRTSVTSSVMRRNLFPVSSP